MALLQLEREMVDASAEAYQRLFMRTRCITTSLCNPIIDLAQTSVISLISYHSYQSSSES